MTASLTQGKVVTILTPGKKNTQEDHTSITSSREELDTNQLTHHLKSFWNDMEYWS